MTLSLISTLSTLSSVYNHDNMSFVNENLFWIKKKGFIIAE